MGLTTKEISSSSFNDMISSVDRRSEYVENRAGANVRLNNFLTPYTLDDKSSILNAPCGYSNGVYPSLRPVQTFGPELIDLTQGTAEQPSQWSNITTNSVNFLPGAAGVRYFNVSSTNGTLISGRKYSLTLEISNYSGSGTLGISTQGGVSVNARLDTNATHSEVFTSDGGLIRIFGRATNSATITVSIKEEIDADFDFTRGSAATRVTKDGLIKNVQILSGELVQNGDFKQIGSELITNGDFATDSDWTKGSAWTIANGQASYDASAITPITSSTTSMVSGKTYRLKFKITTSGFARLNFTNDSSQVLFEPNGNSVNNFSSGEYTFYLSAQNNSTALRIFAYNNSFGTSFSMDNVSVKEVGQNWTVNNSDANNFVVFDGSTARLKFLNTSPVTQLVTSFIMTAGKKYKLTVDVALVTSGSIKIDGNGISETFNTSGITTRIINPTGSTAIKFYRASADVDITLNSVSLIEITDDTNLPRIDYTDGTGSLLLEPQSTNLLTYSEDFSQSYWNKIQISVDDDFIISPDGTQNASKITTNSNTPYLGNTTISLTTGNVYTISCFVKKGTNRWVRLSSVSSGTLGAWFDLDNNVVGTVNSTSASIENYGNGWYRISNTLTAISGSNQTFLGLSDGDGGTTVTGTGHTVFAWGFQVEEQSFATSYIPTSGSTVTRNADVCNNAGSSNLINSTEGVLYAEIAALADDLTFRSIAISDGTLDNRVLIRYRTTSNKINIFIEGSNVVAVNSIRGLTDITNYSKFALKYKSGDIALWVDGVEIFTDTATFTISGLDRLSFDGGNGSDDFYGNVRSVAVFKEALTDEELAKITSTTQQEVFYEMRDKMLQINADYYEFGDYTTRLKKLF